MPNWCNQNLLIAGPEKDRKAIKQAVLKAKDKGFSHFRPCPVELFDQVTPSISEDRERLWANNRIKYGVESWYDWCLKNWGTKWGDCQTQLLDEDDQEGKFQHWVFQSAWSPIEPLVLFVSKKFPKLSFALSYTEESNAFAGYQIIKNGSVVNSASKSCTPPASACKDIDESDDYDKYYEWSNNLEMTVFDESLDCLKKLIGSI